MQPLGCMSDYAITYTVEASPAEVFAAINDVRAWWDGVIQGPTEHVGDVFTYSHEPEHRSVQRITESVPGERVVWHIDEAELTFVEDRGEWTSTDVVFEIDPAPDGARLTFTHRGLRPDVECYEACSTAWGFYVSGALRRRVEGTAGRSGVTKREGLDG